MTTTASRPVADEPTRTRSRRTTPVSLATDAAGTARAAAEDAAARVPEVAGTARDLYDDAARRIAGSSDEMLRLGTAVSFGFAAGLLIGGANRILVGAAIVPVGMLGLTLLDRFATEGASTTGRSAGARAGAAL